MSVGNSQSLSGVATTPISIIQINDNGIMVVRILPDIHQTLELAKINIKKCLEVSGGRKCPLLLDLRSCVPLQPVVRQYYADNEVAGYFTVIAILIEASSFGTAIGNFYLKVSRSGAPKKLFTNEQEGLKWLANFLLP